MPKELFGQDLVNELALGQRIAAGEKNVQGGLNITVEKLFEQIKAYLSDSEVITPENTTVWDEYEVYPAGNVFVSYTNTSSPNPIFHDAAIYRSRVETPYGVSPEDDLYDIITNPTGKWEYQGQKVVVQEGGLSKVFFLNESEIQAVTGYIEGNNAVNLSDFKVYEYSSSATSGIKPNDNGDASGRWVEVGELGGGGSSTFDDLTDTPNAKIAKKLVKVSDDGQDLEYTDYDDDEVVQKAEIYNVGTLKKFDSDGNDEDSGLTGESLDIYDITSQLILALENDNNWLDSNGDQIIGSVLFTDGIKGQRYYSDDFYFECVNDFRWVRTFTGRPVIDIYNNPKLTLLEKSYLEDNTNWDNGSYIGVQMEDVAQGTRYYDNEYVYEFVENNTPVRYLRS